MAFNSTLFIAMVCATVSLSAQTQLARHVVANGGSLAAPNSDATIFLSSTIGQTVIFAQTRGDLATIHQGFWVPLDFGIVGVDDDNVDAVAGNVSNYPNPFSSSTTIRFTIPMDGRVTIRIFNIVGDLVRTISTEVSATGSQEIMVMAIDDLGAPLASGTYLYDVEGTSVSGTPFRRMQRLSILR